MGWANLNIWKDIENAFILCCNLKGCFLRQKSIFNRQGSERQILSIYSRWFFKGLDPLKSSNLRDVGLEAQPSDGFLLIRTQDTQNHGIMLEGAVQIIYSPSVGTPPICILTNLWAFLLMGSVLFFWGSAWLNCCRCEEMYPVMSQKCTSLL